MALAWPTVSTTDDFDAPLVDVVMMLADAAQVADGKLYVLGAGVQVLGPQPQPAALGLLIYVPWDRANIAHEWKIELLDEDGIPVLHNDMPVIVAGQFEAGRPPGWPSGTPLLVPLAINFSALPVQPTKRYTWRLAVNDQTEPGWRVSFSVSPPPQVST
jgi:hypothetical protein